MHGRHAWTQRTEDGEKREFCAIKFGGNWRIQSKLRHDKEWTQHDPPSLDQLRELHDILFRKYQRRRAAFEDVKQLEIMIRRQENE
jgi:hypothetical protein